jgi:transposase
MEKIPKQEYTTVVKERAVKHVKEGKSIGLSAKELGLVEQTLRKWVKLSAAGKLTGAGAKLAIHADFN